MRVIFFLVILGLPVFVSCTDPGKNKRNDSAVGTYELQMLLTTPELWAKYGEAHTRVILSKDKTFYVESEVKQCLYELKGTWAIESDMEGYFFVFRTKSGKEWTSHCVSIPINCGGLKGILFFRSNIMDNGCI